MTWTRWLVVILLLWGAYWALLPWLSCITSLPSNPSTMLEPCTFGVPTAPGYWPNIFYGAIFVVVAVWLAVRWPGARAAD